MAMFWLLQGCQPGDSLLFHYSGHGSQQRNCSGDEVNGYDETICPLDFETQGMITDDEINGTVVRPLPWGDKLHAIIDACHSGTVLDLSYLCRTDRTGRYIWEDELGLGKAKMGEKQYPSMAAMIIKLLQTPALSQVTSTGAMTYAFIQATERGPGNTYGSILNAMRSTIRRTDADIGGGVVTTLILA